VRCFSLHCAERVVTFVIFRLARDIIHNCTRTLWSRSPPIFTFGSRRAYRYKRMGLAQLAVLCTLCRNHFLDFCHRSRSLVIPSRTTTLSLRLFRFDFLCASLLRLRAHMLTSAWCQRCSPQRLIHVLHLRSLPCSLRIFLVSDTQNFFDIALKSLWTKACLTFARQTRAATPRPRVVVEVEEDTLQEDILQADIQDTLQEDALQEDTLPPISPPPAKKKNPCF